MRNNALTNIGTPVVRALDWALSYVRAVRGWRRLRAHSRHGASMPEVGASAVDLNIVAGTIGARRLHAASLASQLAVFRDREPLTAGEVPPGVVAVLEKIALWRLEGAIGEPRRLLLDQAHLLIPASRDEDEQLFGVPVSDGRVGYANRSATAAGCAAGLNQGAAWNVQFSRKNGVGAISIFGLIADDITSVAVEDDFGARSSARVGDNAFYWERNGSDATPRSLSKLVLTRNDGSEVAVKVRSLMSALDT